MKVKESEQGCIEDKRKISLYSKKTILGNKKLTRMIVKSIYLFTILFITYFIVGCENRQVLKEIPSIENDYLTIKPEQEYKQIDFSHKIDSVKFIELEFGDESIVTDVSKIEIFGNNIYILDTQTSSLFVFDMDGNFSFKINSIGEGPGEYTQLDYFDLDYDNREIILTDLMSYWIMRYDLSGNYISRKKIPFWCEGVLPIHDKGTVLYANFRSNDDKFVQEYNLYFLDSLMEISKSYFPYDSKIYFNPRVHFSTPSSGPFYTYNMQRIFFTPYGNMIYHIEKKGLKQKYKIDFGEKNFDSTFLNNPVELSTYMKNGDYNLLRNISETNNYLLFSFYNIKFPQAMYCYYDKRSKDSFTGVSFKVDDNASLLGSNMGTYKDSFISIVEPSSIISWKENVDENNLKLNEGFSKIKYDFSNQLEAADNPVLMIYKLK